MSFRCREVELLLGNDLAGGQVSSVPILSDEPVKSLETERLEYEEPHLFASCAVMRAMKSKQCQLEESNVDQEGVEIDLANTFMAGLNDMEDGKQLSKEMNSNFMAAQREDPELRELIKQADGGGKSSEEKYYLQNGVLMRKWNPIDCEGEDNVW